MNEGHRWFRKRLTVAVLVAISLLGSGSLSSGPAAAVPAAAGGAAGADPPAGRALRVTLLTGDVVQVWRDGAGEEQVSAAPDRKAVGRFRITRDSRRDWHVVPVTVLPLLGSVLDPELFNVSRLVREGHDDARSRELPLIVQPGAGPMAAPLAARALSGEPLPSIGAVAVRQPKVDAARLGVTLATEARAGRSAAAGRPQRIWLDGKVRATGSTTVPITRQAPATATATAPRDGGLDANLTQIGAPAAWADGLDGRGTAVAVLDTGIDQTHPDLRGKVVASRDFSGTGTVADRYGHGTHVAATIAGTGAAARGARKGVAFRAKLVVGKVLDDQGFGDMSNVIAGMEWAAPRARVVNMSLGESFPSDGSDPVSQAVNALTAKHRTLFVVSAGNSGPVNGSIGSPAAARAALTVGAVDANDTLASFSSRGPRLGDCGIKPELTAPGVQIVAAAAAGTNLGRIDRHYAQLSGTSMAAPHVAGAAAILLQAHPAWSPGRLKAALTGTAAQAGGDDPHDRGGGRLNVPAALRAPAAVSASVLNLGTFAYPQADLEPVTKDLTWTNTGTSPVTLGLATHLRRRDGDPAPPGLAALSTSSLTIPAGASRSVTVTIDPRAAASASGLYTGTVSAVAANGRRVLTLISFYVEPPSFDLTVTAHPLPGTPQGAFSVFAEVVNVDDSTLFTSFLPFDETGRATIRVPAGRYSVMGIVADNTATAPRSAIAGTPEVAVRRDTAVALDARRARPVTVEVADTATEMAGAMTQFIRTPAKGGIATGFFVFVPEPYSKIPVYVQPTEPVRRGGFEPLLFTRLRAPLLSLAVGGQAGTLPLTVAEGSPVPEAGVERLAAFDAGTGGPEDFGPEARGKLAVVAWQGPDTDAPGITRRAAEAGAAMVAFANDTEQPLVLSAAMQDPPIFPLRTVGLPASSGRRLLATTGESVTVTGTPASPVAYDLLDPHRDRFPADPSRVLTPADRAALARIDQRFHGQPGEAANDARFLAIAGGIGWAGQLYTRQPLATARTDYVSAGDVDSMHSVCPSGRACQLSLFAQPAAGSRTREAWGRYPLYPAPFDTPGGSLSLCVGQPVTRTRGMIRVFLNLNKDARDHYDCSGAEPEAPTTLRLLQDGEPVGETDLFGADFPVTPSPATFQLVLEREQSQLQPMPSRTSTMWTFRSAGPAGTERVTVPLLLADYRFPMSLANHPVERTALIHVRQQRGTPTRPVTSFGLWTSTDDGGTWIRAASRHLGGGRFEVTLPAAPPATPVSLRLDARDAAGSRIQQTLIRAYASAPSD